MSHVVGIARGCRRGVYSRSGRTYVCPQICCVKRRGHAQRVVLTDVDVQVEVCLQFVRVRRRSGCLSAELVVAFCLGSSGVQPHRPSLSFVSFVVWCEDPESSHMWSKFAPMVSSSSSSSALDMVTGQFRVCVRAHEFK